MSVSGNEEIAILFGWPGSQQSFAMSIAMISTKIIFV